MSSRQSLVESRTQCCGQVTVSGAIETTNICEFRICRAGDRRVHATSRRRQKIGLSCHTCRIVDTQNRCQIHSEPSGRTVVSSLAARPAVENWRARLSRDGQR